MQRFGAHKRDVVNGIAFDAAGCSCNPFCGANNIWRNATNPAQLWLRSNISGEFLTRRRGNAIWLKTGGGQNVSANEDYGIDIAIDQLTGDIVTAGTFEYRIRFDAIVLYSASTALSYQDMYLARQSNPVVPSLGMTTTQHEASCECTQTRQQIRYI